MPFLFAFFALGPGVGGFSLAYLLRHPDEWPGPTLMLAVSLALTIATQTWGVAWPRRLLPPYRALHITATRWGGLALGVILALLAYFVLLVQA
ncbi:MAG: hypothetical protein QHH80_09880 [Anaerolineae bacterium]|jgi:hypothetical protein|nr:hypothetical protein [Anaerolineae bacterium]